ncbi:LOW QUALITY PROTEIN: hypothetical protein HID58_024979 [Brassica napus]|uniref:Methyltransferase type 11 domain-containing protein n=1 Tax=Brassica napus TaxID=3708 RepID=A0ABQ8CJR1_BRANA|nr:LOW QUALITY PROTEIN: hypothetical protein HID58_024979 [Brassica napus]
MDLETENRIASVHNHRNVDHDPPATPRRESISLYRRRTLASGPPRLGRRVSPPSPLTSPDSAISGRFATTPKLSASPPAPDTLRWRWPISGYMTLPPWSWWIRFLSADPHNLPFFDGAFDFTFTAHLDDALFPWRVVEEMERTVRRGRFCVVAVDECGGDDVREIARLFLKSKLVDVAIVTLEGSERTSILLKVQDF